MSLLWPTVAIVGGIALLIISADKFTEGAAATAKHLGWPPLLIGMLIIGFGSSMPEMAVSAMSSLQGNTGLALGNAIGSNITNIALILGLTAILSPIAVSSTVLQRELPYLILLTALSAFLLYQDQDSALSRIDGYLLIGAFMVLMAWSVRAGLRGENDPLAKGVEKGLKAPINRKVAIMYTLAGLIFLIIASHILIWGGVEIATAFDISDLVIGLTVVAIGTSLPELAASISAVRKNEHELALGNVIGSNLFNATMVIGISRLISPAAVEADLLSRDLPVLGILTLALFMLCFGFKGPDSGRINRIEGILLLLAYICYNTAIVIDAMG